MMRGAFVILFILICGNAFGAIDPVLVAGAHNISHYLTLKYCGNIFNNFSDTKFFNDGISSDDERLKAWFLGARSDNKDSYEHGWIGGGFSFGYKYKALRFDFELGYSKTPISDSVGTIEIWRVQDPYLVIGIDETPTTVPKELALSRILHDVQVDDATSIGGKKPSQILTRKIVGILQNDGFKDWSGTLNAYLDFPMDIVSERLKLYAGAGIGFSYLTFLDTRNVLPVYHVRAGGYYQIKQNVSIMTGINYTSTIDDTFSKLHLVQAETTKFDNSGIFYYKTLPTDNTSLPTAATVTSPMKLNAWEPVSAKKKYRVYGIEIGLVLDFA